MSWAISTCNLPDRLAACWAKMSRMSWVRSMTRSWVTSARLRICDGESSPSKTRSEAPACKATTSMSASLPLPRMNLGLTAVTRCTTRSATSRPAVSARAASSVSDASWTALGLLATLTSTARSRPEAVLPGAASRSPSRANSSSRAVARALKSSSTRSKGRGGSRS